MTGIAAALATIGRAHGAQTGIDLESATALDVRTGKTRDDCGNPRIATGS